MRRVALLCLFFATRLNSVFVGNTHITQFPMHDLLDGNVVLTFAKEWKALGPFRIGTRGIREWNKVIRSALVDCGT
jgi:hypothetical protein